MQRLPDWQARLSAFIDARHDTPFEWGVNDCCMFAAQAIEAMTGVNVALRYLGGYHAKREAKEVLQAITGQKNYARALQELPAYMGFATIGESFAQRGDLVLICMGKGAPAFGIVTLDGRYAVLPGEKQLMRVPVLAAMAAWRVG